MNVSRIPSVLALFCALAPLHAPAQFQPPEGFVRSLPDAYVPGKTMTVRLDFPGYWVDFFSFYGEVGEAIPPGWSLGWSNIPPTSFYQDTGTIYWEFEFWCTFGQIQIRYDVTPPPGEMGEVSFDGASGYSAIPTDEPSGLSILTTADTTLTGRLGVTRCVPQEYPTMQAPVDASSFGDRGGVSLAV
ncbi:MAG: hypothetical protein ACE5JI_11740 [Acidobacteriota bacterium]